MRKISYRKVIIFIFLILVFISFNLLQVLKKDKNYNSISSSTFHSSSLQHITDASAFPLNSDIYNYLNSSSNRLKIYNNAIALNNGDSANSCVYFISEV